MKRIVVKIIKFALICYLAFWLIVYLFVYLFAGLTMLYPLLIGVDEYDKKHMVLSDNVDLYINNGYEEFHDSDSYNNTSKKSKLYIPAYENFEYKNCVSGFYILDGSATLNHPYISFVLELQFNDTDTYEEFIAYEHNRCQYTDKYGISYNGYNCYVTVDEEITSFLRGEDIPWRFGMICENKERLTVRYVYFEDLEGLLRPDFVDVFESTNCEW